ncbi:MAG TPA: NAD-dependent epimerase/dehydratase family protein [Dehalococcoidia bacterium]|nr:NAD-dependent epimerase/dehydratase family protein [Dehalococcoidia bacterium]
MRVLVAGGAGFIGSHVCEKLIARGHEVVCLDNLLTGRLENLAAFEAHPRFSFIREDVSRAPMLEADLVLHLASPASPRQYQRFAIETMLANSAGTHRLLGIAADTGARFVFASTSEVYGDPLEHPQGETYRGNVSPNGPRACYDEAKRFGEALTFEYRRKRGVNATLVRIFNTYGPRMDPDDGRVVPAFAVAALEGRPLPVAGDGRQTRSFCYVSDLVQALLLVALDPAADGEVFNIGNDREVTVLELARSVAREAGHPGHLTFGPAAADDPSRRCPDLTRIRQRYGWQPTISLAEGLRETLAWFRAGVADSVAA